MTTNAKKTTPCYACDTGTVVETNLRGRKFNYLDELNLVFDEDLVAPVCDTCGELYLGGTVTQPFGDALERLRLSRKQSAAVHFVERVEREYPAVPRALWEESLSLSHGYLSRVASGKRVPDTLLEIFLEGFSRDPEAALRLLEAAGHMPDALAEALERPRRREDSLQAV